MASKGREPDAREPFRIVAGALLAAVWGGAGTLLAEHLLTDPGASHTMRVMGVACAVAALPPWLWMVANSVWRSRSDDFTHHVMVFGAVVSFVVAVVIAVLAVALERAGFVSAIPLVMVWPLLALVWGVSVVLGSRHYQ